MTIALTNICTRVSTPTTQLSSHASWKEIMEYYRGVCPESLQKQYRAWCDGSSLDIAAEEIKAISIEESGEELVDLKERHHDRISALPDPEPGRIYSSPECNPGFAESSKVRRTLYERLEKMVTFLDELAPRFGREKGEIAIKLFEGCRSIENQQALFDFLYQRLQEKEPCWALLQKAKAAASSEEEKEKIDQQIAAFEKALYSATSKWISPVTNNIPPHATGGAVDLRFFSRKTKQFIPTGGFSATVSGAEKAPTFSEESSLTTEIKLNRLYLVAAAAQAGLCNYLNEHWHFSCNDRYDAFYNGLPHASYGIVQIEQQGPGAAIFIDPALPHWHNIP